MMMVSLTCLMRLATRTLHQMHEVTRLAHHLCTVSLANRLETGFPCDAAAAVLSVGLHLRQSLSSMSCTSTLFYGQHGLLRGKNAELVSSAAVAVTSGSVNLDRGTYTSCTVSVPFS